MFSVICSFLQTSCGVWRFLLLDCWWEHRAFQTHGGFEWMIELFMAGQPTLPKVPPPSEIRPYDQGLLTIGVP